MIHSLPLRWALGGAYTHNYIQIYMYWTLYIFFLSLWIEPYLALLSISVYWYQVHTYIHKNYRILLACAFGPLGLLHLGRMEFCSVWLELVELTALLQATTGKQVIRRTGEKSGSDYFPSNKYPKSELFCSWSWVWRWRNMMKHGFTMWNNVKHLYF